MSALPGCSVLLMYSDELSVQVGSGRTYFRRQTTAEGLFIVAGCGFDSLSSLKLLPSLSGVQSVLQCSLLLFFSRCGATGFTIL